MRGHVSVPSEVKIVLMTTHVKIEVKDPRRVARYDYIKLSAISKFPLLFYSEVFLLLIPLGVLLEVIVVSATLDLYMIFASV